MIPIDFHEPIFCKEKNGEYSVNANLIKLCRTHGYVIITSNMYQMLIDSYVKFITQKRVFEVEMPNSEMP